MGYNAQNNGDMAKFNLAFLHGLQRADDHSACGKIHLQYSRLFAQRPKSESQINTDYCNVDIDQILIIKLYTSDYCVRTACINP